MAVTIWSGTSTFEAGQTPYGFYDTDNAFTSSADQFADWSAKRLGYPIYYTETCRLLIEHNRTLAHPELFSFVTKIKLFIPASFASATA